MASAEPAKVELVEFLKKDAWTRHPTADDGTECVITHHTTLAAHYRTTSKTSLTMEA